MKSASIWWLGHREKGEKQECSLVWREAEMDNGRYTILLTSRLKCHDLSVHLDDLVAKILGGTWLKHARKLFISFDIILTASHHSSTEVNLGMNFRPRGNEIKAQSCSIPLSSIVDVV